MSSLITANDTLSTTFKSPASCATTAEWNGNLVMIKLNVNDNDTIRRIPLYRLLSPNNTNYTPQRETPTLMPQYSKLRQYAICYHQLETQQRQQQQQQQQQQNDTMTTEDDTAIATDVTRDCYHVKMTYVDDEGDNIDFSTDEELFDAVRFLQQHIVNDDRDTFDDDNDDDGVMVPKASHAVLHVRALVTKTTPPLHPFRFRDTNLPFFIHQKKKLFSQSLKSSEFSQYLEGPNPVFNALDTFFVAVGQVMDQLKEYQDVRMTTTGSLKLPNDKFDARFVHNRHACDGCQTSPIVGYRYHCATIPNFDLCQDCMAVCDIPNVVFTLAQNDPDRHYRPRRNRSSQFPFWKSFAAQKRNGFRTAPETSSPASNSRCVVNDAVKNAIQKCVDDSSFEHVRAAEVAEQGDLAMTETETTAMTTGSCVEEEEEECGGVMVENDNAEASSDVSTTAATDNEESNNMVVVHYDNIVKVDTSSSSDQEKSEENEKEEDDNTNDNESFVSLQNPGDNDDNSNDQDVTIDFDEASLMAKSTTNNDSNESVSESSSGEWDVVEDDFQ